MAELIAAKNELWRTKRPHKRLLKPIEADRDVRRKLRRARMGMKSVPDAEHAVGLREVCNADQGGEVEDVADRIHSDHVRPALQAAKVMGPVMCGVDLVVGSLEGPASARRTWVNEVNTSPALSVANEPVEGGPSPYAAERALRHLFSIDG